MEINWFWLFVNWGINFLEFWIFYFVICALLGFRSIEAVKELSFKIGAVSLGYAVFMGIISLFWEDFRYQAVAVVIMILLIRFLSKQLKVRISRTDTILVYFLVYLISHVVVIPSFLLFSSLNLSIITVSFSTFGATLATLFLLFAFIDLTLLYKLVTEKFIVKLIIFMLFAMFVVSFAIFNFNAEQVVGASILLVILFAIAINGLYYMFKFAHEYMNVMPNKYHDVRKILALLNSKMSDITELEEIKEANRTAIELLNIEPVLKEEVSTKTKNKFEALMLDTIVFIQKENHSLTEIIHDIEYESVHPVVDDMKIAYLLGILLENAIQTMTRKPIYVEIFSTSRFVGIKVSNEAKHREKDRLETMLSRGIPTNGKIGRGFGLAKLKQTVKKYKGKVSITQEQRGKTNYLSIVVRF